MAEPHRYRWSVSGMKAERSHEFVEAWVKISAYTAALEAQAEEHRTGLEGNERTGRVARAGAGEGRGVGG